MAKVNLAVLEKGLAGKKPKSTRPKVKQAPKTISRANKQPWAY
jgi:hypothetical protein